ncbi:MAG TPA: hypothetical protein VEX41_00805 [Candidatus Eisenbacteria bacterium]|nr:hypothetical protein [Candidatus Eisenbacteria bacterium]
MAVRQILARAEPGFTLPAFERLSAPPPPDLAAARLEANSAPGDIVADLHGRGGWIARAAVDRQRRAFSLETSPLTRLLAEVVLRPPDLRHIDAAFSALSASPRGETSLKLAIGELFSTRCATCGRVVTADEFTWSSRGEDADGEPIDGDIDEPRAGIRSHDGGGIRRAPLASDGEPATLIRKQYRCPVCRAQQGGPEVRNAPPDEDDFARARRDIGAAPLRRKLRERFPMPRGGDPLVEAILNLHTDRQLVGLSAILDRVEGDLRAAPVEGALRLAFLHAVLPASRLGGSRGLPSLRIAGGTVRTPVPDPWRERNPWLAFEDAFRTVRAFVQRLESGAIGPLEARLGTDLRSLKEGPATAVIRTMTPSALETFAAEARDQGREPGSRSPARPKIRLILSQPPARFSQERLGAAYHGTCWAIGREAASLLPLEPLLGPAIRAPWSWQAATLRRSLEVAAPHMARDGRAVLLLENGGPEALVAAALGGVGAGYRLLDARLAEPDEDGGGIVELVPPGGVMPPGARTRSNVLLRGDPRGSGDPDLVPGPGLFAPAERIDARPFSATEAARSITETAVEVLRARGEPARYERLLGEILVGLDRSGQLRRLVAAEAAPRSPDRAPDGSDAAAGGGTDATRSTVRARLSARAAAARGEAATGAAYASAGASTAGPAGAAAADRPVGLADVLPGLAVTAPIERADPVEQVLALVREELSRPTQRRVLEIEPDRWWLAERSDLESAAVPLADRVEWAVYSLLSTAGPIDEGAFFERIAALFIGHDLPDEALVRACLASYRSSTSTHDRLVTGEDLRLRTAEHTELLALLANAGHRLGMTVSLGRREQERRIGQRTLDQYLDPREREAWLPSIARAPAEDLENVDCIWYLRGRGAFMFEVEWTAMLGDVLLRRHARIPSSDGLVRILALAPERTELARHKLDSSPILRNAIEAGNWHIILWPHLRSWLARDPFDLVSLEPYLGLEPPIDRRGEQMGLFERPEAVR